jgi:hypothetical protein
MKCPSNFAGQACCFEQGHGSLHMTSDFLLVWGESDDDEPEGMTIDLDERDPLEYEVIEPDEITAVAQYYRPFPHVHFGFRRVEGSKTRDCPICIPKRRV